MQSLPCGNSFAIHREGCGTGRRPTTKSATFIWLRKTERPNPPVNRNTYVEYRRMVPEQSAWQAIHQRALTLARREEFKYDDPSVRSRRLHRYNSRLSSVATRTSHVSRISARGTGSSAIRSCRAIAEQAESQDFAAAHSGY